MPELHSRNQQPGPRQDNSAVFRTPLCQRRPLGKHSRYQRGNHVDQPCGEPRTEFNATYGTSFPHRPTPHRVPGGDSLNGGVPTRNSTGLLRAEAPGRHHGEGRLRTDDNGAPTKVELRRRPDLRLGPRHSQPRTRRHPMSVCRRFTLSQQVAVPSPATVTQESWTFAYQVPVTSKMRMPYSAPRPTPWPPRTTRAAGFSVAHSTSSDKVVAPGTNPFPTAQVSPSLARSVRSAR